MSVITLFRVASSHTSKKFDYKNYPRIIFTVTMVPGVILNSNIFYIKVFQTSGKYKNGQASIIYNKLNVHFVSFFVSICLSQYS
jgi:hypothetical protein